MVLKAVSGGDYREFGRRLDYAIRLRGLNGREVAEKLSVDESAVSLWRNGRRLPTEDNFAALSVLLDLQEPWLRYGMGDAPSELPPDLSQPSAPIVAAARTESTVGSRLQAAMRLASLTTSGLARAVGVHETVVAAWLTDRREPRLPELTKLAQALDVTVAWLAFGADADAPLRTLQGRDAYLTPLTPPARVAESAATFDAVKSHVAQGQQHLAAWLVEYTASLLEAAAADTRQQLGAVLDHEGNPVPHDDNDAEVERLNRAVQAQVADATTRVPAGKSPARKRSSGA